MTAADGTPAMFRGFFINLDRARDRLQHVTTELERVGLSQHYTRVRGIPNVRGTVGCFHSHLHCLDMARRQDEIVHVIEDDALFTPEARDFLLSGEPARLLRLYDMVYLDMWVDPKPATIAQYQQALAHPGPMDLRGVRVGCVSSYLVTPDSARKLLRLLRRKEPPVDNLINGLVQGGEVRAAVMVPFLTGIDIEFGSRSQIQKHIDSAEQRRYVMMRTSFFVDKQRQAHWQLAG
ncbi:MAG TPA: glycosyltransferase family 25 protein [Bauldia sp.]|nr:glycosyltransferase family 25 protein [Bauldia sp.]